MQKLQIEPEPCAGSEPSNCKTHACHRFRPKWRLLFTIALVFISVLLFVLLCTAYLQLHELRFSWSAETQIPTRHSPEWIHRRDSTGQRWSICLTKDCIESAAFLLQRIDFSVNPCDNFYEFACGKFLHSYTVPDDHLSRNILQEIQDEIYVEMKGYLEQTDHSLSTKDNQTIQSVDIVVENKANDHIDENLQQQSISKRPGSQAIRKARLFYRSCMNESTVNDEPTAVRVLMNLLTDDGNLHWELLDKLNQSKKQQKSKNLEPALEQRMFVVFLHQIQPIMHFYVAPEELRSPSKEYALHLYSGTTVLESGHLLNETTSGNETTVPSMPEYRIAYAQLQVNILSRLAELFGLSQLNRTQAMIQVQKVIAFEIDLAKITKNFTDGSSIPTDDSSSESYSTGPTPSGSGTSSAQLNSQSSTARKVHYERVRPDQLQKSHSFLDWTYLLDKMERVAGRKIQQVLVESNDYLTQVGLMIVQHSPQTADNYLCWATVARFLPYLGAHFRRLYADFRRKVPDLSQNTETPLELVRRPDQIQHGFGISKTNQISLQTMSSSIQNKKVLSNNANGGGNGGSSSGSSGGGGRLFLSRWKECVHLTTEGLKSASAVLYVQQREQHVTQVSEHVSQLVQRLQEAFEQIVDAQTWLPEAEVREAIKKRARELRSRIAQPIGLLETADQTLADLKIEVEAVFVANIVAMLKHEMLGELRRLNETPDAERDWLMEPLVPNAYYDSLNHFIILPLAILRKPLVSFNRPSYLDYATLGVVIGHEIAHAFDSGTRRELLLTQTQQSGSSSVQLSWWPKTVNTEYERRARCFVSQFSNYSINEIQEKLNGNLTLEENICDFAGLQQAFLAYKNSQPADGRQVLLPGLGEFTADQLFFVQYAQVWCEISNREGYQKSLLDSHAPGRFRANGVVSNSPQYAKAFGCQIGQPMNPPEKCDLWSGVPPTDSY